MVIRKGFEQSLKRLHDEFLSSRRKQSFEAQKAIVLSTDLAHNLLADFLPG